MTGWSLRKWIRPQTCPYASPILEAAEPLHASLCKAERAHATGRASIWKSLGSVHHKPGSIPYHRLARRTARPQSNEQMMLPRLFVLQLDQLEQLVRFIIFKQISGGSLGTTSIYFLTTRKGRLSFLA